MFRGRTRPLKYPELLKIQYSFLMTLERNFEVCFLHFFKYEIKIWSVNYVRILYCKNMETITLEIKIFYLICSQQLSASGR